MFPIVLLILAGAGVGLYLARQGQGADTPGGALFDFQEVGNADPSPAPDVAPMADPVAVGPLVSFDPVYPDIPIVNELGFIMPTLKRWTPPATHAAAAAPYMERIARAEQANGIPDGLLARVLFQESRFRPDIISGETRSKKGATGIAQFLPGTARELGVDPTDPSQSIAGAGRYLSNLFKRFGNWPDALAAYNWGQGNLQQRGRAQAPAETRAYVAQIINDTGVA